MDVKETLTRWSKAYMEPSLFYVPAKKNDDDDYYYVTLHMMVDYFDTVDEKILTDMTIEKMWKKYQQNMDDPYHYKYGSIGQEVRAESVFFVAYDEDGNVADCSLWHDAMSVAEITATEEISGYNIETYSVTKIPNFKFSWNLYAIKNIPDEKAADDAIEKIGWHQRCFYILSSGEIYLYLLDKYDQESQKWLYKKKKIGKYDYNTNKFRIDSEDDYLTYMVIQDASFYNNGSPTYRWNGYNDMPQGYDFYAVSSDSCAVAPILRLKKGIYTIKQIVSSTGCELMKPIKVTVDSNKIIYYKTTVNGAIMRAELIDCDDEYHKIYDRNGLAENKERWYVDGSKSHGSVETINYTYRVSDYKLLVKQRCANAFGGNISGFRLDSISTGETPRITYTSGKIIRWYLTAGEYNKNRQPENQLPLSDNTIISISYGNNFIPKRPLNKQEILTLGIKRLTTGTSVYPSSSTYFYDNIYMYFRFTGENYKGYPSYDADDSTTWYYSLQNEPTSDEIAAAIDKRTLLEWYQLRNEENKIEIKDDGYTKWYIYYVGDSYSNMYDYQNLTFKDKLLDTVFTPHENESQLNIVLDYYKSEDADIENMTKYMNRSVSCYNNDRDDNSSVTNYTNYHILLSSEIKRDEDWNEEIFNNFQTEMRHRLFEEQLK